MHGEARKKGRDVLLTGISFGECTLPLPLYASFNHPNPLRVIDENSCHRTQVVTKTISQR